MIEMAFGFSMEYHFSVSISLFCSVLFEHTQKTRLLSGYLFIRLPLKLIKPTLQCVKQHRYPNDISTFSLIKCWLNTIITVIGW